MWKGEWLEVKEPRATVNERTTIHFIRWGSENHVFNKHGSLEMMSLKREALADSCSLSLWPRILEVRSLGWGYLQLQEREKWFLFRIHTFSLDHCLLIMPPIFNCVESHLCCQTNSTTLAGTGEKCARRALSLRAAWWASTGFSCRGPRPHRPCCLIFSQACSRWSKGALTDSKDFQVDWALLFSFPFLLFSTFPWWLNLLFESASN